MDKAMNRQSLIFLFLSCLSAFPGNSQIILHSADETKDFALKYNAGNKVQQLKTAQTKQNKRTANAFLFPNISAGASGQYNIHVQETPVPGELMGKPGETVFLKFGKDYNYTAGINANYNLLNWTSVFESKTASAQVNLQESSESYYAQQLKQQAVQAYYAVVVSQQAIDIWKQNLAVADSIKDLTNKKFSEGLVDLLSVNQAEINRKDVQQQLDRAQLYLDQCQVQLKSVLSIPDSVSVSVIEKQAFAPVEADQLSLLPDKEADVYKNQASVSDYQMKAARSAFLPQISLKGYFGSYHYSDNIDPSFGSNWKPLSYVGLSVSVPIFTGFANKSKYNASKIEKQMALNNYQEAIRNSQINDSQLWRRYYSALRVANITLEKLKLSEQNMALALRKYEEGLTGLSDYLNTFDANLSIQNQYLTDASQFRVVQAEMEARR
ncbi:MAG: outer rane efflux protein precursor [Bacteroidetes bacterium]|nr:outer rane efflux protein precursor [Bacteroidota bacterium]